MKGKWWLIYNSFPKHFLVGVAWWGGGNLAVPSVLGAWDPTASFQVDSPNVYMSNKSNLQTCRFDHGENPR